MARDILTMMTLDELTESQKRYVDRALDDLWMSDLLARHGLTGGRATLVVLLMFHHAGLPLAIVRDFLGGLGAEREPGAVYEAAVKYLRKATERSVCI